MWVNLGDSWNYDRETKQDVDSHWFIRNLFMAAICSHTCQFAEYLKPFFAMGGFICASSASVHFIIPYYSS